MRLKKKITNSDYSEKRTRNNCSLTLRRQLEVLAPFVSEHKKAKIESVLAHRTRNVAVVLEDIYHPQNASAVLRTCDAMGLQEVHIIEEKHVHETSPRVVRGSQKWLTIHHYQSNHPSETCFNALKDGGYKIYITSLDQDAVPLEEVEMNPKMAFVFGTELSGVSNIAIDMADYKVKISMVGFTDSYNVSVSAALTLQAVLPTFKNNFPQWGLDENSKELIRLDWYKKIVHRSDLILERAE